jgi:ParB-like chromosome segregation protein Spo0J
MIVANIREVGLKKPVTLVRRSGADADGKLFDLVCGQGRIEALIELGETDVPAIIIDASREDQFLMSLVENIARRPPSNRDVLREVSSLRERGYGVGDIAKKLGMERIYITGIVHLIEHEEVALIASVEALRDRRALRSPRKRGGVSWMRLMTTMRWAMASRRGRCGSRKVNPGTREVGLRGPRTSPLHSLRSAVSRSRSLRVDALAP